VTDRTRPEARELATKVRCG